MARSLSTASAGSPSSCPPDRLFKALMDKVPYLYSWYCNLSRDTCRSFRNEPFSGVGFVTANSKVIPK